MTVVWDRLLPFSVSLKACVLFGIFRLRQKLTTLEFLKKKYKGWFRDTRQPDVRRLTKKKRQHSVLFVLVQRTGGVTVQIILTFFPIKSNASCRVSCLVHICHCNSKTSLPWNGTLKTLNRTCDVMIEHNFSKGH